MNACLDLFIKNRIKKTNQIDTSNNSIVSFNKTRTQAEINKLLYKLDDELHNLNISEEKKMKLMKNYKVNLDNDNIPSIDVFEKQLSNANIPLEHIYNLKNLYMKQLTNKKILENDNTYDSLLFLSELSDKKFTSIKIKMLWKTKTLDFDSCIKHLQETERFHIVRYNDYEDFMNKNKIFFDDEHHKNKPKRDVLYRKINDFYFVANNDYFEKCTDFYFKLYSNVFALFNLKKITLKYHNNFHKMSEINVGAKAQIVDIENKSSIENKTVSDNEITLTFDETNISSTLHMRDFNNCTGEYEETNFITNLMPENLKKDMYNTSCILSLIKNRTKNTLSSFEQVQNIENTNIENIEHSVKTNFNWVTMPVGLFGSSKSSDYVNKRVVFKMEFHDFLKESDNTQEEVKEKSDNNTEVERNENTKLNVLPRIVLRPDGSSAVLNSDILGWVRMKRDDPIPKLAVEAGHTKNDGKVYIGRIDKSPGKINCKINTKKIWSFLVQGIGTTLSRQSGQVFITNLNYEWIEISKGSEIPINSIYNGKDENDDQVWIGKSLHNEPGKIVCKPNNDGRPLMDKLWCHGSWCSHHKGYILTVKDCRDFKELYKNELRTVNNVSEFEKA